MPLKRRRKKEVKEDPILMAFGRFQALWPMEGSKLGGPWKVPTLDIIVGYMVQFVNYLLITRHII
jgi:hypothetical protein